MEIPGKNKLLQCTRQSFSIISQLSKDKRNLVTDIKRVFNPNYRRVSFETLNTASLPDQNGLIISVKRSFVNRRPSQRRSMRVRTLVY